MLARTPSATQPQRRPARPARALPRSAMTVAASPETLGGQGVGNLGRTGPLADRNALRSMPIIDIMSARVRDGVSSSTTDPPSGGT